MALSRLLVLGTTALLFDGGAANVGTVRSRDEIMSTMTVSDAVSLFVASEHGRNKPEFSSFIQKKLGHRVMHGKLRAVRLHLTAASDAQEDPDAKYPDMAKPKEELNKMLVATQAKFDQHEASCGSAKDDSLGELEEVRQDIASFNSQAAEARGEVLMHQNVIAGVNDRMPQVQQELVTLQSSCSKTKTDLEKQLTVVQGDLATMGTILSLTSCPAQTLALIQCGHCVNTESGVMMLQHKTIQPMLGSLRSEVARGAVQQVLAQAYDEAVASTSAVALTDEQADEQAALLQTASKHRQRQEPKAPDMVKEAACEPNNKCTLGAGDCQMITDRFLRIQAEIQSQESVLKNDLGESQRSCEAERKNMEAQVADLGEKFRGSQQGLAEATAEQVQAESSSNLKGQQHSELLQDFQKAMKECCDGTNELKSQMCALEKIRGELYNMKGPGVYIVDCSVSDWVVGECSASCGGGVMMKTRSILVQPQNGMACPPLAEQVSCNHQECPIDCKLDDWEGWSSCSAECNGGVRERIRPIVVKMAYGGKPCAETEETEACGTEACDQDCVLSNWAAWSSCSRACGGGVSMRSRGVKKPARGAGNCDVPPAEQSSCNVNACDNFLIKEGTEKFLKCGSKIDLVVLVDGSGSLGQTGWEASKSLADKLINHLSGGADKVRVAVLLFSGPTIWSSYEKCIGKRSGVPDLWKDCGIKWISRFSSQTAEVATKVKAMTWPAATTLTSVALGQAEAELVQGRPDATPIVLVITDGKPLDNDLTKDAAARLMQKARVIWVPVTADAPMELISQLASVPKKENIFPIASFSQMTNANSINEIIMRACPVLDKA